MEFGSGNEGRRWVGLSCSLRRSVPRQDAGCPGMTSCKMRVYSLDFQQKLISPEGEENLFHHQYKISPDVPWLARTLEYCISVKIELDGAEYPLKQCVHSTNFGNSSSAE